VEVHLGSKATDPTEKWGLFATYTLTAYDCSLRCILPSAKVDRGGDTLEGDVAVPPSVFCGKFVTATMLKWHGLIAGAEHEDPVDGHEANFLISGEQIREESLKFLELLLDDAALRRSHMKCQSPSLSEGDCRLDLGSV
jgi:hypothetical protein